MKEISSSQNPDFKYLKQLALSAKFRRKHSQTILDGIHLCQSYLQSGRLPLRVIYTHDSLENEEVKPIIDICYEKGLDSVLISGAKYKAISGVENGVGVAFVIDIPKLDLETKITNNALLLDGVQDPGNMGTILRTAVASGVKEVYLSSDSASVWSPKALRAGMGAQLNVYMYENVDLVSCIENSDVLVLATSLQSNSNLYERDLKSDKIAWLFGSEGQGVSSELMSMDKVEPVKIPQTNGVESLNVAASVAVCLFEQMRQRM